MFLVLLFSLHPLYFAYVANVPEHLSENIYLNTKFYSITSQMINNRADTSINKRTYVQVEDDRFDTFI